jgi:hypothetical protein
MLTLSVRQLLLFAHLIAFAFALVAVVREDVSLLRSRRVDAAQLKATARTIFGLLTLLWITGIALIGLDVGFDPAVLAAKPKLAAKLTVALLLTANGCLLHWVAFPMLTKPQRWPGLSATVCALLGAISSVSWVFAAFVGVSRLIAPAMTYNGFLALYGFGLAGGLVVAMGYVWPHLVRLMRAANEEIEEAWYSTFGPAVSLLDEAAINVRAR